jgi:peptidoglycan/xylan/chitin deacetylase (PgdA/CDA1 family)
MLAAVLFYSGLLHLGVTVLRRRGKEFPAVILFYHRFQKRKGPAVPPKLWIDVFRRQMAHVRREYEVTTLDRLVEGVGTEGGFRNPTVVITMDDGFRDNFELAFPVLTEMDMPATIFLTSGLIGTEKAPWVDEIGMAIWRTELKHLAFPELLGEKTLDLSSAEGRGLASHELYERLLEVEHEKKEGLVLEVLEILWGDSGERCPNERVMLTWDEIRDMGQHKISFGAHTVSHPVLSRMPFEDAAREILDSKEMIEKQVGGEIKHFAIPNGRDEDFTEELREFCKKGVFLSVATTNIGRVDPGADVYRLPRICPSESICVFAFDLARLLFFG